MTATAPASVPARPCPLWTGNFRKIAVNGFGDPHNTRPWGGCYHRGHLYIGTLRDMMVLIKYRFPYEVPMSPWPVVLPESDEELDLRGQVWRYSFQDDRWQRVYRSPLVDGLEGRKVPKAQGFRNMAVFQGTSDREPVIYTIPSCGSYGIGPVLLRCADGENFEVVSEPGVGIGDPNVVSYRGLVPFKNWLFTSPAGSRGGQGNVSYNSTVYCTDDPVSARWHASNSMGFGDPNNHSIFDLRPCGDYLYAGTINIRSGCQLWKTDAAGPPPHRWTKVFDRGADRGQLNQFVLSMAEFRGALYVGTGIQNGGHDRQNNIGLAGGEVLRVWPDDRWELVVGAPRLTRFGPMLPTSGLGPGFDNMLNGYIWRLCDHEGTLYASTFNNATLLEFTSPQSLPAWFANFFDESTLDRFLGSQAGGQLWRTTDGDNWVPVTRNGLNNRYNWGLRLLMSTPHGLVVGADNPFSPQIAVRGLAGVRYADNAQGGLEIWLGSPEILDGPGSQGGSAGPEGKPRWLTPDGSAPEEPPPESLAAPPAPSSSLGSSALRDWVQEADSAAAAPQAADPQSLRRLVNYSAVTGEWAFELEQTYDPLLTLSDGDKLLIGPCDTVEQEVAEFFSQGAMRHVGYWRQESAKPARACRDMIDELWAIVPESRRSQALRVLVAGAGAGAVAEYLLGRQPNLSLTAIVDSVPDPPPAPQGIATVRALPHGLAAPDGTFDVVVWIEGPSRMQRRQALAEVYRVLKPGGQLAASDLVACDAEQTVVSPESAGPAAFVSSYRNDVVAAGLVEPLVRDVTAQGWLPFFAQSRGYFSAKTLFLQIEKEQMEASLDALPGGRLAVEVHVVVFAKKPGGPTL